MKEEEFLYHFPYNIDKEQNFRHFVNNREGFIRRFLPNYNGGNTFDYITNKTKLTQSEIINFYYIFENYRRWSDWYEDGRNIFSFSKELLSMLEKTDVSDIKPDSFHLPYNSFYLSLKPLNIKISKGGDEIIEGVYINYKNWDSNGNQPDGYCDLSFYFVGDFKHLYSEYYPNIKSNISFPEDEEAAEPLGSFWNVWLFFNKDNGVENVNQAIEFFLKGFKEEIFPYKNSKRIVSDIELDFFNLSLQLLNNTINLVINCLLYLSQPKEKKDIELKLPKGLPSNLDKKLSFAKTSKDIKKVENTFEQLGFTKIHYVGQSFERKHYNTLNCSSLQTHWRRGHWRNQKFGEHLKESKIIWILPTIVNNDKGELIKGHLYNVEDNTTNH